MKRETPQNSWKRKRRTEKRVGTVNEPSNKVCFRTLWWEPVRSPLEGGGKEGREGIHAPLSLVWKRVPPTRGTGGHSGGYWDDEPEVPEGHPGKDIQEEAGDWGLGQSHRIWSHHTGITSTVRWPGEDAESKREDSTEERRPNLAQRSSGQTLANECWIPHSLQCAECGKWR